MAPKFRGNSDDWLDDQRSRKRSAKKKGARGGQAEFLPLEQANGVVAEVFPNQCRVRVDESEAEILCSYRRAGVIRQGEDELRERSPVAVGDRVLANQMSPDSGVIEGVCARRNFLARMAPGKEQGTTVHVIASNVDVLVIVASVHSPEFTPGLVDRYLIAAEAAGIEPVVCITKADLLAAGEEHPAGIYRDLGIEVREVSSRSGTGVEEIRARLLEKSVVFCGKSGVGKTSLLRSLLGSDVGRVGEVSESTGKGRHTTTAAVLLHGPQGSQWIDTPGVREFGLVGVTPENLAGYFPEFRELSCARDRSCLHEGEESCEAVRLSRYASYRRILESLRSGEF